MEKITDGILPDWETTTIISIPPGMQEKQNMIISCSAMIILPNMSASMNIKQMSSTAVIL